MKPLDGITKNLSGYVRVSIIALVTICVLLGSAGHSLAATYYVDKTNPNANNNNAGTNPSLPWATLGRAATTLVGGDTVIVGANGVYDERVIPTNSGSAGNPIRFIAATGTRPKVRGWTLAAKRYIEVNGFEVTNAAMSPDSGMSFLVSGSDHIEVTNNYIHDTYGIAVRASVFDGGRATSLIVRNNRMAYIGPPGNRVVILQCFCSSTLIEGNDMSHGEDFVQIWGNHNVLRNNLTHDGVASDTAGNRHLDAYQSFCFSSSAETMNYTLIENNTHANNPSPDDHFVLNNQTDICGGSTTVIIRHNLVNVLGSAPFSMDLNHSGDYADNWKIYNNTVNNSSYNNGNTKALHHVAVMNATTSASLLNNIFVDAIAPSAPAEMYVFRTGDSTSKGDYNLAYMSAGSITWANPLATEPHALLNRNPMFVGPSDFRLQAGSPARGAGAPLTSVASNDSGSGTTLVVVDSHFFQDGWAGVAPDQIAIGTPGNSAQISSINYSTNAITLAAPISRSPGQPIWLFKNSSGAQVLFGAADIGAFPFVPSGSDTTPPTVSMTSPGSGATVSGTSVALSATASDNVGVVGVQFRLNGVNLGSEDTASPYSMTWNTTTVSNGSLTLTAVARDASGNQSTSSSITVTVNNLVVTDTTPPSIAMSAPGGGSSVSGSSVSISANASDNVGVVGVQFRYNGINLGAEDTSSPFSINWNTLSTPNGTLSLSAVARDAAGNQSASAAISVMVSNSATDPTPPTVSMTAPGNGSTVTGTTVALSATASDNVGVVGVQFRLNGTNLGAEDTSSPFSISWNTTSALNGSYSLTAVARDAAGNQTTSAAISVMVSNSAPDPTPPTVSMTAPGNGATVTGTTVALSATASDNVGVVGVQFRLNGTNLGVEDTSSPFSISWNTTTVLNGSYSLTAVARDAAGNQTTSAVVTVTVSNTTGVDTIPPVAAIASPVDGTAVSNYVTISATATDNVGVAGVQFRVDNVNWGPEDTTSPYSIGWDSSLYSNGDHTIRAVARDAAGNVTVGPAVTVTVSNSGPATPSSYSLSDIGGQSWSIASQSALEVGYARVRPATGTDAPSGVAIFGYRNGGVLVSETGVPATIPSLSGRIYAELDGPVKTGIAFANGSETSAVISYYFTSGDGLTRLPGSFTIPANNQFAAFLDQAPFNGPAGLQGTFTFTSTIPVSAIALRGYTNERGDFLMSTLPVSSLDLGPTNDILTFPHFVDGGGWSTGVVLINPTDLPISGTIQFFGQGSRLTSTPLKVRIKGVSSSTFPYWIPPRSQFHIDTERESDSARVGSVEVNPAVNTVAPSGLAIFSYKNSQGTTVSEASVPASPSDTAFRLYVESTGTNGAVGSIRTGAAVYNPSSSPLSVILDLRNLDGTPTGMTARVDLPPGGQIAQFVNEFLPQMSNEFRGIVRITSNQPVVVTGLRGRYNERGDFLMTTTAPSTESVNPMNAESIFPHIVRGGGYTTQVIIFAGNRDSSGTGSIWFVTQDGKLTQFIP